MTQPVRQDLRCYKGQTYSQNFYFSQNDEPISLEGLTAKSQIRPSENSKNLTAEFMCAIDVINGSLNLSLPASVTSQINTGTYAWDLKMENERGDVSYWIAGKFIVTGRVTE